MLTLNHFQNVTFLKVSNIRLISILLKVNSDCIYKVVFMNIINEDIQREVRKW